MELRAWQKECLQRFRECLKRGQKRFVFEACMGAGKSTAAAVMAKALLDDFEVMNDRPVDHVLALVPWALLIVLSIWIILFVATRYVSIGSIAASFSLPFATWFTTHNIGLTVATGAMGALAIYKHRLNMKRLLNGTENRIQFKKKVAAP